MRPLEVLALAQKEIGWFEKEASAIANSEDTAQAKLRHRCEQAEAREATGAQRATDVLEG